ncbi:hypothetical protein M899_3242 [Bacteriovorax sp. BSW11_IV]|nr:hypothetical protein M899_3242 [Bacteriovorax sp. BSW11_IV]
MKSIIGFILVTLASFVFHFGIETYDDYKAFSSQEEISIYNCHDFLNSIKEYRWVRLNGCKIGFDQIKMQHEDIWGFNRTVYLLPIVERRKKSGQDNNLFVKVSDLKIVKEYINTRFKDNRKFFSQRIPKLLINPIEGVVSNLKVHKSGGVTELYYTISLGGSPDFPTAKVGWILLYILSCLVYFFKFY